MANIAYRPDTSFGEIENIARHGHILNKWDPITVLTKSSLNSKDTCILQMEAGM
jgi:hypothetical protein